MKWLSKPQTWQASWVASRAPLQSPLWSLMSMTTHPASHRVSGVMCIYLSVFLHETLLVQLPLKLPF